MHVLLRILSSKVTNIVLEVVKRGFPLINEDKQENERSWTNYRVYIY